MGFFDRFRKKAPQVELGFPPMKEFTLTVVGPSGRVIVDARRCVVATSAVDGSEGDACVQVNMLRKRGE